MYIKVTVLHHNTNDHNLECETHISFCQPIYVVFALQGEKADVRVEPSTLQSEFSPVGRKQDPDVKMLDRNPCYTAFPDSTNSLDSGYDDIPCDHGHSTRL